METTANMPLKQGLDYLMSEKCGLAHIFSNIQSENAEFRLHLWPVTMMFWVEAVGVGRSCGVFSGPRQYCDVWSYGLHSKYSPK